MKNISAILFLILVSSNSMAISNSDDKASKFFQSSSAGLLLGSVSIDSAIAQTNQIGDSFSYLGGYWQGQHDSILMGVGASFALVDDKDPNFYTVQNDDGSTGVEKAEAFGMMFNFEAGYRYKALANLNVDILAGYELLAADRSVSNCADCPVEDIDVDMGLYLKPRISFTPTKSWTIEAAYSKYLGGDALSNLSLGLGFKF
jgi:hypothetical protein